MPGIKPPKTRQEIIQNLQAMRERADIHVRKRQAAWDKLNENDSRWDSANFFTRNGIYFNSLINFYLWSFHDKKIKPLKEEAILYGYPSSYHQEIYYDTSKIRRLIIPKPKPKLAITPTQVSATSPYPIPVSAPAPSPSPSQSSELPVDADQYARELESAKFVMNAIDQALSMIANVLRNISNAEKAKYVEIFTTGASRRQGPKAHKALAIHDASKLYGDYNQLAIMQGVESVRAAIMNVQNAFLLAMKESPSQSHGQPESNLNTNDLLFSNFAAKIIDGKGLLGLGANFTVLSELTSVKRNLNLASSFLYTLRLDIQRAMNSYQRQEPKGKEIKPIGSLIRYEPSKDRESIRIYQEAMSYFRDVKYIGKCEHEIEKKLDKIEKSFLIKTFFTAAIGAAAYVGFQMWDKDEPALPPTSPPPAASSYETSSLPAPAISRAP